MEYFYNLLCSEKIGKEGREKLLVSAIAKLSPLQSSYKLAATLNSLLGKVISAKVDHKSLLGLPNKKDRGVICRPLSFLYQLSLLMKQIRSIAELFNCGRGKRGNKFTQSALK